MGICKKCRKNEAFVNSVGREISLCSGCVHEIQKEAMKADRIDDKIGVLLSRTNEFKQKEA